MQKNGKNIKCKKCKKEFYIPGCRIGIKKYCSRDCGQKDNWGFKPKEKECKICGEKFIIKSQLRLNDKTCSKECWYKNNVRISKEYKIKKRKKKEDWKSYKNGNSAERGKHSRACSNYKKKFKEKYGYLFCERCKCNINATPRFETHHIIFASEASKHKNLHNDKNLILLCTSCHHFFHSKQRENRKELVISRGLDQLFERKSLFKL